MNRIRIVIPMLLVSLLGSAAIPASSTKTPLHKVHKVQGAPSLFSTQPHQVFSPMSGVINFTGKTYDPATIKEVKYDADQKHPIFFKSTKVVATDAIHSASDAQASATAFLEAHKSLISVKSPKDEFVVKSYEKDELGITHIKMTQTYMGKTVWGKEIMVHLGPSGSSVNGRWAMTPMLSAPAPAITAAQAIAAVVGDAKPATLSDATNKLLKYNGPAADLIVYPQGINNSMDRWAYRVVVRPDFINMYEYFVDAGTGEIIHKANISCTTGTQSTTLTDLNGAQQTLNTYQAANGSYYFIDITRPMYNTASALPDQPQGAIWTIDGNNSDASNIQVKQLISSDDLNWPNTNNSNNTATAASAAANGTAAYTYYLNVHGRNSIDGNGGTIISVINVEENGQGMDNAFWNGQLMAYGNGLNYFKPLAGGLDVAGHEMTHGVIQATANLQYENQSGALNESMADVFGVEIGNTNYTIGGTVTLTSFIPTGVLRNLADPHNSTTQGNPGWQPAVMSEYVTGTDDNGGVHTNSGITNHAFYYFATAVGRSTADSIYYRALTKYLVTGSQFLDARVAVIQAATDLYGASSSVVHYAGVAFDSVGIVGTVPTIPLDTAAIAGPDWIIYQSTDNTCGNALYLIPAGTPADTVGLTSINALYRVSITDNGSDAYFVDTNHNVYHIAINTAGGSVVTEVAGLNTGEWDFVSVSRNGERLALISKFQDTAIYIYDLASNNSVKFHLYAPTFSIGITTNGPIYAGTADWDPTGQFVIYDEYNQLYSSDSADVSYWDIGLMQVWNDSLNTFQDSGLVSKLINSLPDGVSIANPVYSKNHANIVAFDYADTSGAFDAWGADLNTGATGVILSGNSVPNVPSFSGEDNEVTYTAQDVSSNMIIGTKPLASDLIDGSGSAATLSTKAEWSVWFRVGYRTGVKNISADNVKVYPVPTSDRLIVDMSAASAYTGIQLVDMTGRVVISQPVTAKMQQLNLSAIEPGVYIIHLTDDAGNQAYTSRIIKN